MTHRIRYTSACGGAVVALTLALSLSGCSSATSETPKIEGKTPAEFREDMDQKISRPLGEPPAKSKRSARRRDR